MAELRWVLIALGILVIVGIWAWGRGLPQQWLAPLAGLRKSKAEHRRRLEPGFGADYAVDDAAEGESDPVDSLDDEPVASVPRPPEKVVTLRFVPHDREIASDRVILALRAAGLKHGRYGIFHLHPNELSDEALFSVASLTEPGSFDMARLSEARIPGMSFFMILPGVGDPVETFDKMVAIARELARELDGELRDEKGSSWSIQRERYVREEIIEYRDLLEKPSADGR
jgi:cell division protein ZipA